MAPNLAPHQAQGAWSWSGLRLTRGRLPQCQGQGQASIPHTPGSRVTAGRDWGKVASQTWPLRRGRKGLTARQALGAASPPAAPTIRKAVQAAPEAGRPPEDPEPGPTRHGPAATQRVSPHAHR